MAEVTTLRPLAWGFTSRLEPLASRETADPLGLRAWSARIARRLVPGLTGLTRTVQGYALIAGMLPMAQPAARAASAGITVDEAWGRLSRLWVHAQARHAAADPQVWRWAGHRKAAARAEQDVVALTAPLLSGGPLAGIWATYRRSAGRLGVARPAVHSLRPADTRLSPGGGALSEQVRAAWGYDRLAPDLRAAVRSGTVSADLLARIPADRGPRPEVARTLADSC